MIMKVVERVGFQLASFIDAKITMVCSSLDPKRVLQYKK